MVEVAEAVWLDYKEAAARVRSSEAIVRRWAAAGMPMVWGERNGQRARLVDEQVLLTWWREKLKTAPVAYYRRRRRAREQGLPDPEPPATLTRPRPAPVPDASSADAEDVTAQSERSVDWDSIAMLRRGADEYAVLSAALEKVRPACDGHPGFIADRITPDEARTLAKVCSACPVRELCAAFAEASRPTAGFWAGRVRGVIGRTSAARDAG
ncbi:WhiB family transcriptional regulator [Microbacterium sp. CPCC 204701]|uniref:WhiB family transcriptional regulator n=1 Tax=Microbacterium sp. CPCC 204701 TaxID=2493084 RepID=UPI000FDB3629|nr:WhiB family transcriptional regulator [Microbacterium sp. CPCC 204701]